MAVGRGAGGRRRRGPERRAEGAVAHHDLEGDGGDPAVVVAEGDERYVAAVGRDVGRAEPAARRRAPVLVPADEPCLARRELAYVDVFFFVEVVADERLVGHERDGVAVGADRRLVVVFFFVAFVAVALDARTDGGAGGAVAHEDVLGAVVVVADEVLRVRAERDAVAVGTYRGLLAVVVAFGAVGRDTHARGGACGAVAHEDVGRCVRVTGHEVGGGRLVRDVPAVGADRRVQSSTGAGVSRIGDVDDLGRTGCEVTHVHVDVPGRGNPATSGVPPWANVT
ncbi:MAG: hypothetical protein M5T61_05810 [Acidimicrobiia bacterium]|nr:hypothetical protein [Acidimicrobiia bacterium]